MLDLLNQDSSASNDADQDGLRGAVGSLKDKLKGMVYGEQEEAVQPDASAEPDAPAPTPQELELQALRKAYVGGVQTENDLTDLLFYTRHADMQGAGVQAGTPEAEEWISIRNELVRPFLKDPEAALAATPSGTPDATVGEDVAARDGADQAAVDDLAVGDAGRQVPGFEDLERELDGRLMGVWVDKEAVARCVAGLGADRARQLVHHLPLLVRVSKALPKEKLAESLLSAGLDINEVGLAHFYTGRLQFFATKRYADLLKQADASVIEALFTEHQALTAAVLPHCTLDPRTLKPFQEDPDFLLDLVQRSPHLNLWLRRTSPDGQLDSEVAEAIEQGKSGTYLSQRDNTFNEQFGGKGVYGDNMCNVTALTMQLITMARGKEEPVKKRAIELIRESGGGGNDAELMALQPEDLIMRLFAVRGDAFWKEVSKDGADPFGWSGWYDFWKADPNNNGWHQISGSMAYTAREFTDLVSTTSYAEGVQGDVEYFKTEVAAALQSGGTVTLSTSLTGGHIVALVGVEEGGLRINDPYGMKLSSGYYVKNAKSVDETWRIEREWKPQIDAVPDEAARRCQFNKRTSARLPLADLGGDPETAWGENTFYNWDEVKTWRLGKWLNIVMP